MATIQGGMYMLKKILAFLTTLVMVFAFVGCKREGRVQYGLHSPKFDIDENALYIAAALYAAFAYEVLR